MVCDIDPRGSEKEWGAGRRSCDGVGDGRDAIALGGEPDGEDFSWWKPESRTLKTSVFLRPGGPEHNRK